MLTSQIISRVQRLFGDSNGVMILESDVIDWINEAQLEIAKETLYKVTNDSSHQASEFIAGVSFANSIVYRRVLYDTKPLDLISRESIDLLKIQETPGVLDPASYYFEGQSVFLYPTPQNTDSTTVTVSYAAAPTDLVNSSSNLDVPVKFHNDVAVWCLMRANERNENYRAAEMYAEQFRKNLGERKFESLSQDDSYYQVGVDPSDWETYGAVIY